MISLPPEIWRHVATFIPWKDLPNVSMVSHLFNDLANRERYRVVHFVDAHSRDYGVTLNHLKDPTTACQVRTLIISPRSVSDYVYSRSPRSEALIQDQRNPEGTTETSGISKLLRRIMRSGSQSSQNIRDNSRSVPVNGRPAALAVGDPDERKASFMAALSGLQGLVECQIRGMQGDEYSDNADHQAQYFALIAEIWPIIGPNLTVLSLDVSLPQLLRLLPVTELHHLRHLAIQLSLVPENDIDPTHLTNTLVPFVNSFSHTLRTFELDFIGSFDPSLLYRGLHHMPHLTELSIKLPSGISLTAARSGVTDFMKRHSSTLEALSISIDRRPTLWVGQSIYELQESFRGITFPRLRVLKPILDASWKILLPMIVPIARLSISLTTLDLAAAFLAYPLVDSTLAQLSGSLFRIRQLSLSVHLPPIADFVDLLAEKLPRLDKLMLTILDEDVDFVDAMHLRADTSLGTRPTAYDAWKLRDITILCCHGIDEKGQVRHEWEYMDVMAKCIPSIQSFANQGNKVLCSL